MPKEIPENVIWLEDGEHSRYVHKYERQPYALGDVATFFDYHEDDRLDYDSAITCRVVEDLVYGEIAKPV